MGRVENKLLSIEKRLDELEETMEILGNRRITRSIAVGLKDLREGRFRRYESVAALFREIKKSR